VVYPPFLQVVKDFQGIIGSILGGLVVFLITYTITKRANEWSPLRFSVDDTWFDPLVWKPAKHRVFVASD